MDFKQWFYEIAQAMPLQQALKIFGIQSLEGLTMDALMDMYRQAAKQSHPDAGGSDQAFQQMQAAFETLQMTLQDPQQAQAQQTQQAQAQQAQQPQQVEPEEPVGAFKQAGRDLGWMGGQLKKSFMNQGEKVFGPKSYNYRYGPNWAQQNV